MRAVFIRLLQVIWVLTMMFVVLAIVAITINIAKGDFNGDVSDLPEVIASSIGYLIALIVMQYILLGNINPIGLFNGSLYQSRYPR